MKWIFPRRTAYVKLLTCAALMLLSVANAETLYVPSGNNIYAVDANGHARVVVDATNPYRTWSQPLFNLIPKLLFSPDGSFPFGLAFDSAGNLYSTHQGTDEIFKFHRDGQVSDYYDSENGINTEIGAMVFDKEGNLFVMNVDHDQITRFSPRGAKKTLVRGPRHLFDTDLVMDHVENLYAVDDGNNCVVKIRPDGYMSVYAYLPQIAKVPYNSGKPGEKNFQPTPTYEQQSWPRGLAFDRSGVLYVSDYRNCQISKIGLDGVVKMFAQLPAHSAPGGLAFDSAGNLFVALSNQSQLVKITPEGVISTFATGLSLPRLIAFGPEPVFHFTPTLTVILALVLGAVVFFIVSVIVIWRRLRRL